MSSACSKTIGLIVALLVVSVAATKSVIALDVRFDVQSYIECQDVTTEEFRVNHPNEMLIQVTLDVAADVLAGHRDELTEFDLRVRWQNAQHSVVDFLPRNVTDSSIDGLISIEQTKEKTSTLGLDAGVSSAHNVNANGHASRGNKDLESVRFARKPKQHLLISSGMVNRGSGVFIKIRRTDQHSLEGLHRLVVTFRVPSNWRGDLLVAECRALKTRSRLFENDRLEVHSQIGFVIPVFMQGDEQARYRALSYREAESKLWQAAETSLHATSSRNIFDKMGVVATWKSKDKKQIDRKWLDTVVQAATIPAESIDSTFGDEFDIPKSLSIALKNFQQEKNSFQQLAGEPHELDSIVIKDKERGWDIFGINK